MPGRFELKPTLEKVWHAPDNFRFMDPLPPMHRRGSLLPPLYWWSDFCFHLMIRPTAPVVTREAQLDIQSQSQPPTEEQLRAQLVTPQNDPDQVAPVAPEPIQEGQPEEQPQTTQNATIPAR
ncbi:cell envelope opacity-associated protein [Escherichia coli]|uniref:Cell envelope opacity-associated protein n=1 Tax=Escherichia coli TaxID=562 RepID=A0A2X3M7H1_ECOLX|nr:cell envelope opacity-associated protein [Escherichia coli]